MIVHKIKLLSFDDRLNLYELMGTNSTFEFNLVCTCSGNKNLIKENKYFCIVDIYNNTNWDDTNKVKLIATLKLLYNGCILTSIEEDVNPLYH